MNADLPAALLALNRARQALAGRDDDGLQVHPSMFDPQVISFAHGEGLRRPHPQVIRAGIRALLDTDESSLENYLFLRPFPAFEERITREFVDQGIPDHVARNVAVDSGTTRLFWAWIHATSRPGDTFLTAPTFYHPLADWCHRFGVHLVCVPTRRDNDYKLTRSDLEGYHAAAISEGELRNLRCLFLFNPTQTGAIYGRAELEEIAGFVLAHDLQVVEDSIFWNTEYEREEPWHLAAVDGMADRVVTLDGGSKSRSLANVRIGWACGPRITIERMKSYAVSSSATVPHIAKAMALAALEAPPEYLEENRAECRARAILLRDCVGELNALIATEAEVPERSVCVEIEHMPRAGHSMLLSLNGLMGLCGWKGQPICDSIDLARCLLAFGRVAVSPGLSSGFADLKVRLCFGCVGLERTYAASRRQEALHALAGILPFLESSAVGVPQAIRAACEAACGDEDWCTDFQYGRGLIREALLERMPPVLVRLLRGEKKPC
jgi:aspartate aminotransferase